MRSRVAEFRPRATASENTGVAFRCLPRSGDRLPARRPPAASPSFDRDFSRVPVRAEAERAPGLPAREADMRGDAEEPETDGRQPRSTRPAPTQGGCRATATGVSLGFSRAIHGAGKYGLRTPIIVHGTHVGDVLDSELVGTSIDHTGSMVSRPSARSNNSGFMRADRIPDDRHASGIADHLDYFDNHGGDGSYSRLQMDLYKIPTCGINTPRAMPNSGYRIKRTVRAEGTSVVGIVKKTAEAVTIGAYTTAAGLTRRREARVTLRP